MISSTIARPRFNCIRSHNPAKLTVRSVSDSVFRGKLASDGPLIGSASCVAFFAFSLLSNDLICAAAYVVLSTVIRTVPATHQAQKWDA